MIGLKGEPGTTGQKGPKGYPGADGQHGNDGALGPAGTPGVAGLPRSDGQPGLQGTPGEPSQGAQYCPCPKRSNWNSKKVASDFYDVSKENSGSSNQYIQAKTSLTNHNNEITISNTYKPLPSKKSF